MFQFGNFFLFSALIVGFAYSGNLQANENNNLIVTRVTVETPLPTGLESVVVGADESNQFYREIKEDPRVKPFVSAAEKNMSKKLAMPKNMQTMRLWKWTVTSLLSHLVRKTNRNATYWSRVLMVGMQT